MSRPIDGDALRESISVGSTYSGWAVIQAIDAMQTMKRNTGRWVLDEDPHDGDCRCSACCIAISEMHERNHPLLNALTGGKWWTFYKYCPQCGAKMKGYMDYDPEKCDGYDCPGNCDECPKADEDDE